MELRRGQPLWLRHDPQSIGHMPLDTNIHCDVAIIGAGITGALVAEHLTEAGVDVVVMDRLPVCRGSTAASTGLIQYELDTSLLELIEHRGAAEAFAAYRVCVDALQDFFEYLTQREIACELQPRQSLFLAVEKTEVKGFREEQAARAACGIGSVFLTEGELREQFSLRRPCAIWSPGAFAIDPYLTATGLWKRALALGARLYSPSAVEKYDADDTGVTLTTDGAYRVRARYVVFATGYETPTMLTMPVELNSTFAIASGPGMTGTEFRPECLIWESATPYLYVRSGPGGRIIVGGCDVPGTDAVSSGEMDIKAQELIKKFEELYPGSLLSAYSVPIFL